MKKISALSNLVPAATIEKKIFLLHGHKILLGPHLAELYNIETRVLMQSVRRNIERFPKDFMFELTRAEISGISQFVTSLKYSKMVYAFTEQGVAMLSSVLNSPRAIQMNIAIMRAFVQLRQILSDHTELLARLNELEHKIESHDSNIRTLFQAIRQLMEPPPAPPKRGIGFHVEEPKAKYFIKKRK